MKTLICQFSAENLPNLSVCVCVYVRVCKTEPMYVDHSEGEIREQHSKSDRDL